ncbi:fimbrial protein [Burkholderia multivorans]|uniref:fimbrial protein n=1 Tax=Burkholderia multivorans TaxID=87883 RepID=UPI000CFEF83A|nr:fimbrial protein [Burkholderia multivorans]MBU9163746.1 type 1 fimbrial protein [Burkholderia multivorans]MBU9263400.1 type 1 fimbrial protein [Burkholderia multivorans]PRF71555.1 fimbrial protein [Burkholderia multivorans]
MKNRTPLFSAAVLVLATMSAAHASDGTINFTGSVVASTCKISNKDGSNLTIPLPQVATSQLAAAGSTAGRTPFAMSLSGCTSPVDKDGKPVAGVPAKVAVVFEPGPNVNLTTGRLKPTGTDAAANVEVGIQSDSYSDIKIGASGADQGSQAVAIGTDGNATLQYFAQYYATGASTAGSVNTSVTYSVVYP